MLYDVNTNRIEDQLDYLDRCLSICNQIKEESLSELQEFALARALHIAVECMIDIGSVMIDGFVMRDPGGYQDIVDILEDEQVITPELALIIKKWVELRERLVRQYTVVDREELLIRMKEAAKIRLFIVSIKDYLTQELAK